MSDFSDKYLKTCELYKATFTDLDNKSNYDKNN